MAGVDCVGLLIMVARKLGLPHTDDPHYRMRPQPGRLMESLRRSGLVEVAEAKPGDVVAFDCSRRGVPYHVGILATFDGRPTVIHAIARGRVEEVSFDGEWESKHVSSWAYPGLEN